MLSSPATHDAQSRSNGPLWHKSARIGMDRCGQAWMDAAGGWMWMDSGGRSSVLRRLVGVGPTIGACRLAVPIMGAGTTSCRLAAYCPLIGWIGVDSVGTWCTAAAGRWTRVDPGGWCFVLRAVAGSRPVARMFPQVRDYVDASDRYRIWPNDCPFAINAAVPSWADVLRYRGADLCHGGRGRRGAVRVVAELSGDVLCGRRGSSACRSSFGRCGACGVLA